MAAKRETLGFIGLGVMGGRMARRLLDQGYPLMVYDINAAAMKPLLHRGARAAGSAREVANNARTVFASLPAPPVLREVARDVARGEKIEILVDLSTTGSRMQKEVAALLRPHRITLLDAPVSGGATGAEKGTLAVMVAGDAKTIATLRKPLGVLGKLFIVGNKPGQAQLLKLLNNMLSQTALAVSLEALVAGVKGGLDADLMIAAINAGSGRNTATEDKIPRAVLTRTFDFGFPIAGACKDIGLAVEECQAMGLPMVVGSAVRQLWQFAYNQGGGKEDMTALVKFLEPWAKVRVRGRAARARR